MRSMKGVLYPSCLPGIKQDNSPTWLRAELKRIGLGQSLLCQEISRKDS